MNHKQFLSFIVCGGIAALANIASRIVFSLWMNYSLAIVFAFIVGMITAFILFRVFVFSEKRKKDSYRFNVVTQILWYIFINAIALLQTWGISIILYSYIFPYFEYQLYPDTTAHIVGVMVPVITSYIGHKFLTFR